MERLADCAQVYCEMYCKKYGTCFEDPGDCIFKDEIKLYEAVKRIEGIVPFERLLELACADKAGLLVLLDEKTALSMYAGARAIENNKRLFGATYVYDVFGKQGGAKEIPYFDAANNLRNIASAMSLKGGE